MIRFAGPSDHADLFRMRRALWPDSTEEEIGPLLARGATEYVVLLAVESDGRSVGFAEVGTRSYAEGCATSPVAYLEGIWVEPKHRRSGVAAALLRGAEGWARTRGVSELASDFAPDNAPSRRFHAAVGFDEVEVGVFARKEVGREAGLPAPPLDRAEAVVTPSGDPTLTLRPVEVVDWDAVWRIVEAVVRRGDTYAYPTDMSRAEGLATWVGAPRATYVAESEGRVVGTYYIKSNHPGQGSHVCNAGYMVAEEARGRGIGATMCRHSLEEARRLGYEAMQYNLVVSTNTGAIGLWERMGFATVGRLPGAFRHPSEGPVDALVMYRIL